MFLSPPLLTLKPRSHGLSSDCGSGFCKNGLSDMNSLSVIFPWNPSVGVEVSFMGPHIFLILSMVS